MPIRQIKLRRCHHSAEMQAELDGLGDRGQVPAPPVARRPTKPSMGSGNAAKDRDPKGQGLSPFIEPGQLRPEFHKSDDGSAPLWFAIWNTRRSVAYALDAYPDELIPYERSLRNARREVGDQFAGPFNSQEQAKGFAVAKLVAGRKRLSTGARSEPG